MEALNLRAMALMVIIMVTMMGNMAKSEQHNVGGSKTSWDPKINFTEWASHEQFHVGDWLYFGYGEKQYSVLEVNNASYVSCNETGFIKNITGGAGRDVFELKEAKTYYFISGGGFCYQGLKVAINVAENLAPSPQHSPKKSHSASDYCLINQTLVVLILVLIWGILFK